MSYRFSGLSESHVYLLERRSLRKRANWTLSTRRDSWLSFHQLCSLIPKRNKTKRLSLYDSVLWSLAIRMTIFDLTLQSTYFLLQVPSRFLLTALVKHIGEMQAISSKKRPQNFESPNVIVEQFQVAVFCLNLFCIARVVDVTV